MPSKLAYSLALILGSLAAAAQSSHLPWHAGDPPPMLAGLKLGASRATIDSVLGQPVHIDTLGNSPPLSFAITNAARGISVVWAPDDGAAVIGVDQREAGTIDSIRVADDKDRVLQRWGAPTQVSGARALYIVGTWVIVVELGPGQRVTRLQLGYAMAPSR